MEVVKIIIPLFAIIGFYTVCKFAFERIKEFIKRTKIRIGNLVSSNSIASNETINSDEDAWEGSFYEAADPIDVKAHLKIKYTDSDNKNSEREIIVRRFDESLYNGLILSRCLKRNATRSFRVDRITECIDLETGEVVSDVKSHLLALYKDSPGRFSSIIVSDYIDVVKVLNFICAADGAVMSDEKVVVAKYFAELIGDEKLDLEAISSAFDQLNVLSLRAYKMAVGRIVKAGAIDPNKLIECCKSILNTQTKVHAAEQEALDYIINRVSQGK